MYFFIRANNTYFLRGKVPLRKKLIIFRSKYYRNYKKKSFERKLNSLKSLFIIRVTL